MGKKVGYWKICVVYDDLWKILYDEIILSIVFRCICKCINDKNYGFESYILVRIAVVFEEWRRGIVLVRLEKEFYKRFL